MPEVACLGAPRMFERGPIHRGIQNHEGFLARPDMKYVVTDYDINEAGDA